MKKEIILIDYSSLFSFQEATNEKNMKDSYFDIQKVTLLEYIIDTLEYSYVEIISLNKNFSYRISQEHPKRIKLPFANSPLLSIILFNMLSFLYLIKRRNSILLIYSGGLMYPFLGALASSKLFKMPIFLIIRNPPLSLCPFRSPSLFKKIIYRFLDKLFFNYSDYIIHISNKSKNLFINKPILFEKSIVMGSSPSSAFLNSQPIAKESKKKIKDYPKIFSYWGIIDKSRDLETVILGFKRAKLSDKHFKAKLFIYGTGNDLERLRNFIKEIDEPDVFLPGQIDQNELCEKLINSLAAVIAIPSIDFYQYSAPLKLAEAIYLELPIIASYIEPNIIVEDYNLGFLCKHDTQSYAKAFIKIYNMSEKDIIVLKENCSKVKQFFSTEFILKDFIKLLEQEYYDKHYDKRRI